MTAAAAPLVATRPSLTRPISARSGRTTADVAPARRRSTGSVPVTAAAVVGRPQLLLPPVAEPAGVEVAAEALLAPLTCSVLSPVTERSWPVQAGPGPRGPEEVGDPTQLCGAIVLAAVEALTGARPLVQLTRWVTPPVLEAIGARAMEPGRVARRRASIRRIILARVSARAAEASVVVHDGTRVRAAAVRLELHRGSWRACVLQIG